MNKEVKNNPRREVKRQSLRDSTGEGGTEGLQESKSQW